MLLINWECSFFSYCSVQKWLLGSAVLNKNSGWPSVALIVMWRNEVCVCGDGGHWYLTVRLPWLFEGQNFMVFTTSVLHPASASSSVQNAVGLDQEDIRALSFSVQLERLHNVEGWHLSEMCCLPASLFLFFSPPRITSNSSCSSFKLGVLLMSPSQMLLLSTKCSSFFHPYWNCWCKCICWSQQDLCCQSNGNWWIFWSSEEVLFVPLKISRR